MNIGSRKSRNKEHIFQNSPPTELSKMISCIGRPLIYGHEIMN